MQFHGTISGNASGLTNGAPTIATNNVSASDGDILSRTGGNLKWIANTGGGGGSATNAVTTIQTNSANLSTAATNLNFAAGLNFLLTGSSNLNGTVKIVGSVDTGITNKLDTDLRAAYAAADTVVSNGVYTASTNFARSGDNIASGTVADARIASTITRDTEWDTIAEIVTATGSDIVTNNRALAHTNLTSIGSPLLYGKLQTNGLSGTGVFLAWSNGVPVLTNVPASGGSLTPWTSDINAAGYSLTNLNNISATGSLSLATLNATNTSFFGVGGSGLYLTLSNNVLALTNTPAGGSGDAVLSAAQTWTGDNTLSNARNMDAAHALSLSNATASRVLMAGTDRTVTNVGVTGPLLGTGAAAAFSDINSLAAGNIVSNGNVLAVTVINKWSWSSNNVINASIDTNGVGTFTGLAAVKPSADATIALGTVGQRFTDVYLSTSGSINWSSGDVTLGHSTDAITVSGGNLLVTTPGTAATSVVTVDGVQTLSNKNGNGITNLQATAISTNGASAVGQVPAVQPNGTVAWTNQSGTGGSSTFVSSQFSSTAGGTNIISGAPLTNVNTYGTWTNNNTTNANWTGGFWTTNTGAGTWSRETNGTVLLGSNTLTGVSIDGVSGRVTLTNVTAAGNTAQLGLGTNAPTATAAIEVWNPQGTRILDLETNGAMVVSNFTASVITNSSLTASRVIVTDANKKQTSVSVTTPILGTGAAAAWSDIQSLAPTVVQTNGATTSYSNDVSVVSQAHWNKTNLAATASVPVPDFSKEFSLLSTNADFAFSAAMINLNANLVQRTVVIVTNAAKGSLMAVTIPNPIKLIGTANVTNNGMTTFTFTQYGGRFTNCLAQPAF